MKLRLRWQGWNAELTPRAWRTIVITAFLTLAAGADALPPALRPPTDSKASVDTVPAQTFNTARADSIIELIAIPPAPVAVVREAAPIAPAPERTSPQVALATDELRARALLLPLPGLSTRDLYDSFNEMRDGGARRHRAIDISAARGTPVLSVDDGTVIKLHYGRFGGIALYASDPSGRFTYYYAHLDSYHPNIRDGLHLNRGDTIGFVGISGNSSIDGAHLHFAAFKTRSPRNWSTGTPINPFVVFTAATQQD